jgi:hypothetical protein
MEADVFRGEGGTAAEGVAAGFGVNTGVGLEEGGETSGAGEGETGAIRLPTAISELCVYNSLFPCLIFPTSSFYVIISMVV